MVKVAFVMDQFKTEFILANVGLPMQTSCLVRGIVAI